LHDNTLLVFELAPHALQHNALSSCMTHLSVRPRVRGAGTRGADEVQVEDCTNLDLDQGKPQCI
jgi:hypothetical protein